MFSFKFVGTTSQLRSRFCAEFFTAKPCYSRPLHTLNILQPRHSPLSPLQSLKTRFQSQNTFFSSSRWASGRARPPPGFNQPPKRSKLFESLDNIPPNLLFYSIVGSNAVVFLAWQLVKSKATSDGDMGPANWMFNNFTSSWRNLSSGRIWTLLTATVSQKDFGHMLFNGISLFWMARPVLDMLGPRAFLALYVGGGLFSCVASIAWNNLVKHRDISSLGASGSVYATMAFLACTAPRLRFLIYGLIPVPAWLAVSGLFMMDTFSAVTGKMQQTTDTAGHVAGLLGGIGFFVLRRFRIFV